MTTSGAPIEFHSLSDSDRVKVTWGFLWRMLVISLATIVVAGVIGAIFGFFVGLANAIFHIASSREAMFGFIRVTGGIMGFAIGVGSLWFLVDWLFRARIAGYRLRLVVDVAAEEAVTAPVIAAPVEQAAPDVEAGTT
jgi:hypothetical protein